MIQKLQLLKYMEQMNHIMLLISPIPLFIFLYDMIENFATYWFQTALLKLVITGFNREFLPLPCVIPTPEPILNICQFVLHDENAVPFNQNPIIHYQQILWEFIIWNFSRYLWKLIHYYQCIFLWGLTWNAKYVKSAIVDIDSNNRYVTK